MIKTTTGTTLVAIGDIHGKGKALDDLLDTLREHGYLQRKNGEEYPRNGCQLVFLGDYIDRGVQQKATLERVSNLQKTTPDQVHCLLGNHELLALASYGDAKKIKKAGRENDWERHYRRTPHGLQNGEDLIGEFGGFEQFLEAIAPTAPLGEFLRGLEPALEVTCGKWKVLCLHAGTPKKLETRQDLVTQTRGIKKRLADEAALQSPRFDPYNDPHCGMESILWDRSITRGYHPDPTRITLKMEADIMLVGHTRQEAATRYGTNIYAIDLSGRETLAALVIENNKIKSIGPGGEEEIRTSR